MGSLWTNANTLYFLSEAGGHDGNLSFAGRIYPNQACPSAKNKKLAIGVNAFSLAIMMVMFVLGTIIVPLRVQWESRHDVLLSMLFLLLSVVVYIVAHELIHGFFFKRYSDKRAKYGFTGLYAYAGSDAYFNKRQYLVIGLSPVVILGFLSLLLNVFLSTEWFWRIYFLQLINLSGAAGDFYIVNLMRKLPADMLVQDTGLSMTFYSRNAEQRR